MNVGWGGSSKFWLLMNHSSQETRQENLTKHIRQEIFSVIGTEHGHQKIGSMNVFGYNA